MESKWINRDYVQAPCAYLRMVIRDSGLHKVWPMSLVAGSHTCMPVQIVVVTNPSVPENMRHPCLEELKALQHPYNVTIHGASAYEDFSFLTKAHHLVLSGVSSFADSAVLLSRCATFSQLAGCRCRTSS